MDREKIASKRYKERRNKAEPWYKYWRYAVTRCSDPTHHYYKRGVKCFLTLEDVRFFWERDKAHLLSVPSLDRINGEKDYTRDNCRFIELSLNRKPGKSILQLSLKGEIIKRFGGIMEAGRILGITYSNISECANHKQGRLTAGGYKWKLA